MRPLPGFLLLSALLLPAGPAAAQYIYIDTDGDGVHSAADVIQPAGETTLDIWLRTDTNKDGSPALCAVEGAPLTIGGYQIVLRTSNGSVTWGAFTNHIATMSASAGPASGSDEFAVGFSGGTALPVGAHRLGSLAISVAAGTPEVYFAPVSGLPGGYLTAFESTCPGSEFDFFLKLGTDWTDADGAAYGGVANVPPALDPPADMTVAEGVAAEQALVATDPEGQPVAFTLREGPAYASVITTDSGGPGGASATGLVRLAPGYSDAGSSHATVRASDGFAWSDRSFGVTVTPTNRAPVLQQPLDMMAPEGQSDEQYVGALDPDGDDIQYAKTTGPDYMTVTTVNFGSGANQGRVRITPGYGDAADMVPASVSASDGFLSDTKEFMIMVRNVNRPPAVTVPGPQSIGEGDRLRFEVSATDPDGDVAALEASPLPAGARFEDHADNTGTFEWTPAFGAAGAYSVTITARDPFADTAAADVAIAVTTPVRPVVLAQPEDMVVREGEIAEQGLSAFDASGDPLTLSLHEAPPYASVILVSPGSGLAEGRLRLEPGLDAAGLDTVTVTASDGIDEDIRTLVVTVVDSDTPPPPPSLPFAPPFTTLPTGDTPHTVTIGDLNQDGVLDLAVANLGSNTVSTRFGAGDGTFGPRTDYPTGVMPHTVAIRDLDQDGIPDLAITNMGSNSIGIMRGLGDGTFAPRVDYPMPGSPMILDLADLNHDGSDDIAVTNQTADKVTVYLNRGDATFGTPAEFAVGVKPHGMDIADVDGDGNDDLIVANDTGGTVSVLLGAGDGTFGSRRDYVTSSPHIVQLKDVNGDGSPDMVVANFHDGTVSTMLDGPDHLFRHVADLGTGAGAHGVALGDLDGDGHVDLAVANQLGHTLSLFKGAGDGTFGRKDDFAMPAGAHSIAIGDLNRDGAPDLAVSSIYANQVTILLNRSPSAARHARAFVPDGHRTVALGAGPPYFVTQVEPVDGSFDPAAIDPATVTLERPGDSTTIPMTAGKAAAMEDRDRNGVIEMSCSFSRADLAALLGDVRGRADVALVIRGSLTSGGRFEAPLTVTVVGIGNAREARVFPNPLNPSGTLEFATENPGPIRVRLYDARGRLVRTLEAIDDAAPGPRQVLLDGRDDRGRPLASGIYYLRIETPDGRFGRRLALVK